LLIVGSVHAAAAPRRFPYLLVSALGVGQLVAWGSFYYVFVSLTDPMADEFGWTKTQIAGALSVALATTGLCSYLRGRWIDRYGGRSLMTGAAFFGAALLFLWAHITELWHLYVISVGIGIVSAMLLYDAVFAVVARMLADYRKAIIVITLFGGLASTVFVPLTQFLLTSLGWRDALICLAVIHLPFTAGVPYLLLRGHEKSASDAAAPGKSTIVTSIKPALAHPVFWLLALSFVSYAFLFTSLIFNLVPMLRERGYTSAEAVAAYACIGPSQLAGRVAVLTMERFISLTVAGLIGTLFPVFAMIVLMTLDAHSPLVIVFAIAFGTGMGIKTIVQATAAPEFLGRAGYGALQGALMLPVYLAQAVSPFLAAWIWRLDGGYELLQVVLLVMAGISAAAFLLAARLRPGRIAPLPLGVSVT
jgi:MFS family permease